MQPEIKQIDFYSANDRYFGDFLRDTCFNPRPVCSKWVSNEAVKRSPKCQKPLYQHTLCILHNGFALYVTASNVGTTKNQSDSIRVWRYGRRGGVLRSRCKCGQETTPEVLGQSSQYLSMGVVLQLLFYDDLSKAPSGHNLFRDRVSVC